MTPGSSAWPPGRPDPFDPGGDVIDTEGQLHLGPGSFSGPEADRRTDLLDAPRAGVAGRERFCAGERLSIRLPQNMTDLPDSLTRKRSLVQSQYHPRCSRRSQALSSDDDGASARSWQRGCSRIRPELAPSGGGERHDTSTPAQLVISPRLSQAKSQNA